VLALALSPLAFAAAPASAPPDPAAQVERYRAAVERARAAHDAAAEIDARIALAAAYQAMGHVTSAVDVLDESLTHLTHGGDTAATATGAPPAHDHAAHAAAGGALPLARQLNDPRHLFAVYRALAATCMFSELSFKAPEFLDEAERLAKELNDPAARASAADLRGVLLAARRSRPDDQGNQDLGNYTQALSAFRDALAYSHDAGDDALAARIAVNRCLAARHNGQSGPDERSFDADASTLVEKLPAESPAKLRLLLTLGFTEEESDDSAVSARAYAHLRQAREIAESRGDPVSASYAIGYTAGLYEAQRRYDDALTLTGQALFQAQRARSPDALYRWQWQAGRIYKAQGRNEEAIAAYRRAADSLAQIRNDISLAYGNPNMRSSFREVAGGVYYDLADLLISRGSANDLADATSVIEQLKTAELEDYFQDKCANLYREQQKELRDVAAQNRAAIIYYVPLEQRLEILVMLPDGVRRFSSPIARDELMALMRRLHDRLAERNVRDYEESAKAAYNALFAPIEDALKPYTSQGTPGAKRVDTLVFVPDGAIRSIPMAALMAPDGSFLIERYPVCVSPGLQLMPPQSIGRDSNATVLANGLSEKRPGYEPLTNVPDELRAIQSVYGLKDRDKLLNDKFTIPNLDRRFEQEQYAIVHVATHGEFGENARDTYLLTHDDRLDLMRLERLIEPSKFRGRPVELLTLSACHTAQGAGDRAALGLAGVAIKAGARSAMATLWEVDDEATTALVASFYRHLHDDTVNGKPVSKAQALRSAQLEILRGQRGADKTAPYFWAPYLIIGNWL
jgi:CHAT domain-containing protein